jgi:putative tricarboxylic transport membrane protein
MEIFNHTIAGFSVILTPNNIFYCFMGVLIGTLIGVLPGIGPTGAIAILLPSTFHASPVSAIIMLAGIYYGAQYGGSTTSILINIPGEASSVVTCLDGYQMARQGRAGPALGIAAFGSFIGGTLSIIGLTIAAPPLAKIAIEFGPPEYFSLLCMGLAIITYLASGSIPKALIMACFGLIAGCVGLDQVAGIPRFTFGVSDLLDGIGIVPVVMGLFGISEVLINIERETTTRDIYDKKIKGLLPSVRDWLDSKWAIVRGTFIGFFLGILPGGGALISSYVAYGVEKKVSKHRERFGKGAIEGVAGPETANNAATGGAFIPLLTLGIPSNVVMAVLIGALMIHGISPGPLLIQRNPEIFWGVICSMYIGNIMLLILNLPLIGLWIKVLRVPYKTLFPLIILFCLIGAYSVNWSLVDVYIMIISGIFGYVMNKMGYEGAPLILAFILGPMLETSLRQSLLMSQGNFSIFFIRPISLVSLIVTLFLLISPLFPWFRKKRIKLVEGAEEIR